MLIEKSYVDLAMSETLRNWLIDSEIISLSVKISRLLCIGGLHHRLLRLVATGLSKVWYSRSMEPAADDSYHLRPIGQRAPHR